MGDTEFDRALIAAFFRLVAEEGWRRATVAAAAQAAGLPLARARERFSGRATVLLRFGRMADQMALAAVTGAGSVRDRLFDLLMRRFDALQAHRAGVVALMRTLPREPALALLLSSANRRSMRWMLQAAEIPATGLRGELQVRGLLAIWLWAMRAWERDESPDLSGTMAALDSALARGEQVAGWLSGGRRPPAEPPPADVPSAPGQASPLPGSLPPEAPTGGPQQPSPGSEPLGEAPLA